MIGAAAVGLSVILLIIGIGLVFWDWTIRHDADAPHGGPMVTIAVIGLLCGGVISCAEAVNDVRGMKSERAVFKAAGNG